GRAIALFESFLARRLAHEPLAYILGRKEFWTHREVEAPDFRVAEDVGERFVRQPSRQERLKQRNCAALGDKRGRLDLVRELPQQARVEARTLAAGFGETAGGVGNGILTQFSDSKAARRSA